jgi:hypothetical protein
MREITDHKLSGLNDALKIVAIDESGCGGANHEYQVSLGNVSEGGVAQVWNINFQNGPILEAGFNGLSNESLLAIVIDRMRGFQSGQFAGRDNAVALTKLEEGMMWLQKRTLGRMARGVEGTHQK